MTCLEKYKMECGQYDLSDDEIIGKYCCSGFGYLPHPDVCELGSTKEMCTECWNREIPENSDDGRVSTDDAAEEISKFAEVAAKIDPLLNADIHNSILDSGNRTEFESGAVRDMHEGKGRCDLMPLDVIADVIHDEILGYIYSFQKYGSVPALLEILRKQKIFPDIHTMFLEVAKHFEDGCKKYGEDNWRKGIPCKVYIDSAVRHYLKHLRGDTDERHDRAFIWNIMCCIWTYENKPELRGGIGGESV